MIIADTSVWIDYFNGIESVEADILDSALDDGAVAIGDIIFLEILQGFRSDKDFKMAKSKLSSLDQYEMFGHLAAYKCAENYRFLRKKGITIRKTTDIIIATFCIDNKIPLLFSDRDFIPFTQHLELKSALQKT
ncbi:MAG: PIN domain nuclease [gamma proteobacterium endosymbiont of Lamellibrachia anaximandri]|nr:PIN domain nuclease [gamma proteobacterium endosymbiont of Lamellibrachia anaximandri]